MSKGARVESVKPSGAGARESRSRGIAGLLALAVIAFVGAAYLRRSGATVAKLSDSVPDDVSVYVEVPSLAAAFRAAGTMKGIDPAAVASSTLGDMTATALTEAFTIPRVEAEALALDVVGVAYAGRPAADGAHDAWLFAIRSTKGWDALAASNRFTRDGAFGVDGKAYRLAAGGEAKGATMLERRLRSASTSGGHDRLVFYPKAGVVAFGDEPLVRDIGDVLSKARPSLDRTPAFHDARGAGGAGDAAGSTWGSWYADGRARSILGGGPLPAGLVAAFAGEPAGGDIVFTPAGLRVDGSFALDPRAIGKDSALAHPAPLTLASRLPAETALAFDASLKRGLRPAEAKAALVDLATRVRAEEGKDALERDITGFEQAFGLPLQDLFEMAGDEVALGLLLTKDFKFSLSSSVLDTATEAGGLVVLLKVDGDAAAQRVVVKLRAALAASDLGPVLRIADAPDGFAATAAPAIAAKLGGAFGLHAPALRVRYAQKELAIAVCQPDMLKRTFAALDTGEGALKGDGGYQLALASLRADAAATAWLDLGHLASIVYTGNPAARADAQGRGWPVDALHLSGADRLSVALSLSFDPSRDGLRLRVEALNPWVGGLLAGWQATPERRRSPPNHPGPPSSFRPGSASLDDMPVCKDTLGLLELCIARSRSPEARARFEGELKEARTAYTTTPNERAMLVDKGCIGVLTRLQHDPDCLPVEAGSAPSSAPP